jgi:hypothetical protein
MSTSNQPLILRCEQPNTLTLRGSLRARLRMRVLGSRASKGEGQAHKDMRI